MKMVVVLILTLFSFLCPRLIADESGKFLFTGKVNQHQQIFEAFDDGSTGKQITLEDEDSSFPSWCPKGGSFACRRGDDIVWLKENGELIQRIHYPGMHLQDFDWSPDGSRLAYSAREGTDFSELHIRDFTRSADRRLAKTSYIDEIRWSPNGRYVAYIDENDSETDQIQVVNADDGVRVARSGLGIPNSDLSVDRAGNTFPADLSALVWAPNSRSLCFSVTTQGTDMKLFDIEAMKLGSIGAEGDQNLAWSPDGRLVVTAGGLPPGLFVQDSDGSNRKQIEQKGYFVAMPVWARNAAQIAFFSNWPGIGAHAWPPIDSICVIDADGSNMKRVTRIPVDDDAREFSWSRGTR